MLKHKRSGAWLKNIGSNNILTFFVTFSNGFRISKMKKAIITSSIILGVLLLIAILFIGLSGINAEVQSNETYFVDHEPLSIVTGNDSIVFTINQVPDVRKMFNSADILALNSETYADSNVVVHMGYVGVNSFDYHFTHVSSDTKLHRILIQDTITKKEVCVIRYDKFTDNLK
jgi:hypothetical protein